MASLTRRSGARVKWEDETERGREDTHRRSDGLLEEEKYELVCAGVVGLVTGGLYLCTMHSTLAGGDSGDMVATSCNLGVAHPPGYPLHTILGAIFVRVIPFGNPAFRVNLLSVCCGTCAAMVLAVVVCRWLSSCSRKITPAKKNDDDGLSVLKIEGLVRPFTEAQLREKLSQEGGAISWMWVNKTKSMCLVIFAQSSRAAAIQHTLHGVTWPPASPSKLQLSFTSHAEAQELAAASPSPPASSSTAPPPPILKPPSGERACEGLLDSRGSVRSEQPSPLPPPPPLPLLPLRPLLSHCLRRRCCRRPGPQQPAYISTLRCACRALGLGLGGPADTQPQDVTSLDIWRNGRPLAVRVLGLGCEIASVRIVGQHRNASRLPRALPTPGVRHAQALLRIRPSG